MFTFCLNNKKFNIESLDSEEFKKISSNVYVDKADDVEELIIPLYEKFDLIKNKKNKGNTIQKKIRYYINYYIFAELVDTSCRQKHSRKNEINYLIKKIKKENEYESMLIEYMINILKGEYGTRYHNRTLIFYYFIENQLFDSEFEEFNNYLFKIKKDIIQVLNEDKDKKEFSLIIEDISLIYNVYNSFKKDNKDYLINNNRTNFKNLRQNYGLEDDYYDYKYPYYNIKTIIKYNKKKSNIKEAETRNKKTYSLYLNDKENLSEKEYFSLFKRGIDPFFCLNKINTKKTIISLISFLKTKQGRKKYYLNNNLNRKSIIDLNWNTNSKEKLAIEILKKVNHTDFIYFKDSTASYRTLFDTNRSCQNFNLKFIQKFYKYCNLEMIELNPKMIFKLNKKIRRKIFLRIKNKDINELKNYSWLRYIFIENCSFNNKKRLYPFSIDKINRNLFSDISIKDKKKYIYNHKSILNLEVLKDLNNPFLYQVHFYEILKNIKKGFEYYKFDKYKNIKLYYSKFNKKQRLLLLKWSYKLDYSDNYSKERLSFFKGILNQEKDLNVLNSFHKYIYEGNKNGYYKYSNSETRLKLSIHILNNIDKLGYEFNENIFHNILFSNIKILKEMKISKYSNLNQYKVFKLGRFNNEEDVNYYLSKVSEENYKRIFKINDFIENPLAFSNIYMYRKFSVKDKSEFLLNCILSSFKSKLDSYPKELELILKDKDKDEIFKLVSKEINNEIKNYLLNSKIIPEVFKNILRENNNKDKKNNLRVIDLELRYLFFKSINQFILDYKTKGLTDASLYNGVSSINSIISKKVKNGEDFNEIIYLAKPFFEKSVLYLTESLRNKNEENVLYFEKNSPLFYNRFNIELKKLIFKDYKFFNNGIIFFQKYLSEEELLSSNFNSSDFALFDFYRGKFPKKFIKSFFENILIKKQDVLGKYYELDRNILNIAITAYQHSKVNNYDYKIYLDNDYSNMISRYIKSNKNKGYYPYLSIEIHKFILEHYSLNKIFKMFREYNKRESNGNLSSYLTDICNLYKEIIKVQEQYQFQSIKFNSLIKIHGELNSIYIRLVFFNKKLNQKFLKKSLYFKEFEIREPRTKRELAEWGRELNHCVGTYWKEILNENSIILGIFINKKLFYTIEIQDRLIQQFQGKGKNGRDSDEDYYLIRNLLNKKGYIDNDY